MFKGTLSILLVAASVCHSLPYGPESKKDIFLSRGWGAGGMPFSVLYMNPTFSSPKAETTNAKSSQRARSLPQVRTAMRQQKNLLHHRTPHSVIPQLFVSYGWGPLGK